MKARLRVVIVGLLLITAVAGCDDTRDPAGSALTTPAPSPPAGVSPLVGTWSRITTCDEHAAALKQAGLERFTLEHAATGGWLPGVTEPSQIKDPKTPCKGAMPRRHEHFFTLDGQFGSRNAEGEQVDDGVYQLFDDRTVLINDVSFTFTITGGDTLRLDPVIPDCVVNGCYAAQWAVAVAYPGLTWKRVAQAMP